MIDSLAQAFLFFTNGTFIIPFMAFGYFWLDKIFFSRLIGIILLSSIINVALKVSFQVPLLASVGHPGFAFPSGHMQLASVLYGWFILRIPKFSLRLVLIALLLGIGFGLVHFNYHRPNEVLAGAICGFFFLFIYQYLVIKFSKQEETILLSLSLFGLIYNYLRYNYLNSLTIPPHLWSSYMACVGLILGEYLFLPKSIDSYELSYDLAHSFRLYSSHLVSKINLLRSGSEVPSSKIEESRRCFLLYREKKLLASLSFCILALLIYLSFQYGFQPNSIVFELQWLFYLLALPLSLRLGLDYTNRKQGAKSA